MLCYHCMREKGDAVRCPYCGKENAPDPALHHLPAGAVIGGRYLLGAVLGEGGFGITYIGLDQTLAIPVAVKEYYPYGISHRTNTVSNTVEVSAGGNAETFEKGKTRFLNEARNVARFRREPGIVDVSDFIEENNTAYIIMEYIDGIDLSAYLKQRGVLTAKQAIALFTPVMKTLAKLHAQGVIHRDISPDNLMVLPDGSLKLIDFGAARQFDSGNRSMSVMLKQGYAPAEQHQRSGDQGPWTDVYALCATIYRCITGITPVDSLDRVFDDRLQKPSALGAVISEHEEQVLLYGLAVRKEDRCQSMTELLSLFTEQQEAIFVPSRSSSRTPDRQTRQDRFRTMAADETDAPVRRQAQQEDRYHTVAADDAELVADIPAYLPAKPKSRSNIVITAILGVVGAAVIAAAFFFILNVVGKSGGTSASGGTTESPTLARYIPQTQSETTILTPYYENGVLPTAADRHDVTVIEGGGADAKALYGEWQLVGGTSYVFDGQGRGVLLTGVGNYTFTYSAENGRLKIDMDAEYGEDKTYTYTVTDTQMMWVDNAGDDTYQFTKVDR